MWLNSKRLIIVNCRAVIWWKDESIWPRRRQPLSLSLQALQFSWTALGVRWNQSTACVCSECLVCCLFRKYYPQFDEDLRRRPITIGNAYSQKQSAIAIIAIEIEQHRWKNLECQLLFERKASNQIPLNSPSVRFVIWIWNRTWSCSSRRRLENSKTFIPFSVTSEWTFVQFKILCIFSWIFLGKKF